MSERSESGVIKYAEPVHLTITLNAKGKIQYEISVHGQTDVDTAEVSFRLEDKVKERYGKQLASQEEVH